MEELLSQFRLSDKCNVRVNNLSGGEQKRLAFACSSIHDPGLFLADEPTTGLDASSAIDVVRSMKAMPNTTTICTIHQPSSELFHMFDDILLMAEGGRVAYYGPVRTCSDYFRSIGHICPETFNPADFLISCLALDEFHAAESQSKISEVCAQYQDRLEPQVLEKTG